MKMIHSFSAYGQNYTQRWQQYSDNQSQLHKYFITGNDIAMNCSYTNSSDVDIKIYANLLIVALIIVSCFMPLY